jgi:adenylate cyclase
MAIEIERKFLVDKEKWNALSKPKSKFIRQGYITTEAEKTIRVRITDDDAFLTIKGKTTGFSRTEIECNIPVTTATEMLQYFSITEIVKERYQISYQQHIGRSMYFMKRMKALLLQK